MLKGILAVVAASVLYGLMPIFSKEVLLSGLPTESMVFFRFTLSALTVGIVILRYRISLLVTRRQLTEMVVAGICGFGLTAFLLSSSYNYMPVGLATMFHFVYPILVTGVMVVLYHEPFTWKKGVAALLATGGIFLMGIIGNTLSAPGVVLSLASGGTYAAYTIANEKCAFRTLHVFTILFYVSLSASVFFGVKAALGGQFQLPGSGRVWFFLFLIGMLCTALSLSLFTTGIRILGASVTSFLNMLEPVTSLVAGVVVYHDLLTGNQMLGSLLILASAFLISLENFTPRRKAETQPEEEKTAV